MTRRKLVAFTLAIFAASSIASLSLASADSIEEAKPIRIGMAKTFFNDIPKIFVDIATDPFKELMKKTTGLNGDLHPRYDSFEVARRLEAKDLEVGVFHGHEFAWARQKYPNLRPLMVAVNKHHDVRGYLVVAKDNPAKSVAELRGKTLALPLATRQHCRVFVAKNCTDNSEGDPATFFGLVERSVTPEVALDDVCRGKAEAAIVDTIGLEFYKEIKGPCFHNNLRILVKSDAFPSAVIACRDGGMSEATIVQFRDGLLKAHEIALGRDMMEMWKISSFEPVPVNYSESLAQSLKAYPAPEGTKISLR